MINNEIGEVKVSKDVINTIVKLAVTQVEAVSGIANRDNKKNHTKIPNVQVQGNQVKVSVYVSFYYGSDIRKEVENLQLNIKDSIETMLGLKASKINVYVYDITPKEEN